MNRNLIRYATIAEEGKDTEQFAVQKVEYLGKTADSFMVNPYGIHGNVPAGGHALMFAVQGNPENRAAMAWTPADRPQLAGGEVTFYHPPTDATIIWRASGDLDIQTGTNGTANINITCKDLNVTCETADVTASTSVDITTPAATVTSSTSITLDTPTTTMTGDLQVDGDLNADGTVTLGGGGGAAIARTGDAVSLGVITGGSAIHKAT